MMRYTATVLLLVAALSAQNAQSTNKGRHLDIPAISREANGAVVSIVMSNKDGHPIAQGSGFLISKDGQVVTNYHVIRNGSSAVIKLPDGGFFAVDGVLASDKNRDVAVIKMHGNNLRILTLGDSDRLQVGEEVVAIGNPLSLESTVSNGIVSAIRTVEDEGGKFVQITAPISPGSSGGPLFNMAGEVVGITTSHLVGGENLNFAIPINDVKPMLLARSSKARALPDEPEPVSAEPTTGGSLADTLRWMVNSSADGIGYDRVYPGGYFFSSFRVFTNDVSCHYFKYEVTSIDEKGAEREYRVFDLTDVDPNSIQEDGPMMKFSITNNLPRIHVLTKIAEDGDHLNSDRLISSKESQRGGDTFRLNDGYRSRFLKAFKNAVILCGGKPSTF